MSGIDFDKEFRQAQRRTRIIHKVMMIWAAFVACGAITVFGFVGYGLMHPEEAGQYVGRFTKAAGVNTVVVS